MRLLVTGGTGTLGREIVPQLREAGHIVRVMSRRPGHDPSVEWARADLSTAAGLCEAVAGVEAVAHLASRPYAAEQRVQDSDVPWSILRATQFHTLVDAVLTAVGRLPVLLGPADMPGQPVDPRDVAERLVTMLEAGPSHTVTEFGGPQILTFAELADQWLDTRRLRRRILEVPVPGRAGRAFRDGLGLASQPPYGRITWREWLARTYTGLGTG